jgi:hypothetical protein
MEWVQFGHNSGSTLYITNGTQASVGYLSLKQGAGAKIGTDGRTFYLWYDKESVLYKVPSTIIREEFNPNSLISQ